MGSYKLSDEAESDLIRIYQYVVSKYGERQAEKYFHAFFYTIRRIIRTTLPLPKSERYPRRLQAECLRRR